MNYRKWRLFIEFSFIPLNVSKLVEGTKLISFHFNHILPPLGLCSSGRLRYSPRPVSSYAPESTNRYHVTLAVTSIAKVVKLILSIKKGSYRKLVLTEKHWTTRDFRLPPRSNWELRLLGYYVASSGNFLPTFRDNLSFTPAGTLRMGPIGCPETSARIYHYLLSGLLCGSFQLLPQSPVVSPAFFSVDILPFPSLIHFTDHFLCNPWFWLEPPKVYLYGLNHLMHVSGLNSLMHVFMVWIP
jgi:hypothetical protein